MKSIPFLKKFLYLTLSAFLLIALFIPANQITAHPHISESQELSFGVFAVRRNDAVYEITVDINDNVTHDAVGIVLGPTAPQRAEYELRDQMPNTILDISLTDATLTAGGAASFTITNYTHNNTSTDAGGDATVLIGATLRTSGDGTKYPTGNYTGTTDLFIGIQ